MNSRGGSPSQRMLRKSTHHQVPPKVEYGLTDWGQALCPALGARAVLLNDDDKQGRRRLLSIPLTALPTAMVCWSRPARFDAQAPARVSAEGTNLWIC